MLLYTWTRARPAVPCVYVQVYAAHGRQLSLVRSIVFLSFPRIYIVAVDCRKFFFFAARFLQSQSLAGTEVVLTGLADELRQRKEHKK